MSDDDFERAVCALIADTFGVDVGRIGRQTTADDVEGWDSLGHSILLARLGQRLKIDIDEEVGFESKNVGELVDRLAAARGVAKG